MRVEERVRFRSAGLSRDVEVERNEILLLYVLDAGFACPVSTRVCAC